MTCGRTALMKESVGGRRGVRREGHRNGLSRLDP